MTTKHNESAFRMIANPYLLKKKHIHTITHKTFTTKLHELFHEEYPDCYFHKDFLNEITTHIQEHIHNYQIDSYIHNFVDECIENALSEFDAKN